MPIKDNTAALQGILAAVNNLPSSAVLYTEQSLTKEQQTQARTNIGAGLPALTIELTPANLDGIDAFTHNSSIEEIITAVAANRVVQCKIILDTNFFVSPFVTIVDGIAFFATTNETTVVIIALDDEKAFLVEAPLLTEDNLISHNQDISAHPDIQLLIGDKLGKDELPEAIKTALGYTPADAEDIPDSPDDIGAVAPAFYMNLEFSELQDGVSCSHTYSVADIMAAYEAGRLVQCLVTLDGDTLAFPLVGVTEDMALFVMTDGMSVVVITVMEGTAYLQMTPLSTIQDLESHNLDVAAHPDIRTLIENLPSTGGGSDSLVVEFTLIENTSINGWNYSYTPSFTEIFDAFNNGKKVIGKININNYDYTLNLFSYHVNQVGSMLTFTGNDQAYICSAVLLDALDYAMVHKYDVVSSSELKYAQKKVEILSGNYLLGSSPLTLTEDITKLTLYGDGETTYTLQSETIADLESSPLSFSNNVTYTKYDGYYELAITGECPNFYNAFMNIPITGLTIGESYDLIIDGIDMYEPEKNIGYFVIYDSNGFNSENILAIADAQTQQINVCNFTATTETVIVRCNPANNYYFGLGITIAKFKDVYVNRANTSTNHTEIVNESGTFVDIISIPDVKSGIMVSANPYCDVYSTKINITDEDIEDILGYKPLDSEKIVITQQAITPDYTNQIPLSVDENGNMVGCMELTRINDDGSAIPSTWAYASGFIPVKKGDIIRVKDEGLSEYLSSVVYALYKEDKGSVSGTGKYMNETNLTNTAYGIFTVDNDILTWDTSTIAYWHWDNFAWLRVTVKTANAIVTVNEEITESAKDQYILKPEVKVTKDNLNFDIANKPLTGKTIVCFGDSIFGMYRDDTSAPANIAEYTGATVYNVGFGGCRMSTHPTVGYSAFSMWALADAIVSQDWTAQDAEAPSGQDYFANQVALLKSIDFNEVDSIVIHYGTNDFTGSVVIDNTEDLKSHTTLCGALRYSIEKIISAYPKLQFYISLPCFRVWINEDGIITDSNNYANGNGNTIPEYIEALRAVAAEYNFSAIDNYHEMGVNKFNAFAFLIDGDGTHHNAHGRKVLGEYIGKHLTSK